MVAEQEVFHDCDEFIPGWLNFVEDIVDSEDLSLGISRGTLQRNKILHVIKKTLVKVCLVMLSKIAVTRYDYERCCEHITDLFMVITQLRASDRVAERIADEPFPHITEKVGASRLIPQERSQQLIVEEVVGILAPQFPEHVVETVKVILQERMRERIAEEFVDVPVHQIQEEIIEVIQVSPQECIPESIVEQIMDVPVLQIKEQSVDRSGLSRAP